MARYLIDGIGVDSNFSEGIKILDTLSRKQFGLATLKLGELLRDGALSQDGREEILERLRELSSHGERRARKILQEMGLEEHIAPAEEHEKQEPKRYSPAVYG